MIRRAFVALLVAASLAAAPALGADYAGSQQAPAGTAGRGEVYAGYDRRGGPALPPRGGLVTRIKDVASLQSARENDGRGPSVDNRLTSARWMGAVLTRRS